MSPFPSDRILQTRELSGRCETEVSLSSKLLLPTPSRSSKTQPQYLFADSMFQVHQTLNTDTHLQQQYPLGSKILCYCKLGIDVFASLRHIKGNSETIVLGGSATCGRKTLCQKTPYRWAIDRMATC